MGLGLLELRSISLAARLGSLSRTADALNITQSALSRRIAEAERTLGITLFDRLPRGVKPTEACLAFLQHAEIALTSINEGREAALDVEKQRKQAISIGLPEVFCDDLLLDAYRSTLDAFEGAAITFNIAATSAGVSADLLAGETKLGLRYRRDTSPQLEATWIADDPVVVACSPSYPLANAGKVTMDQLERGQWIGPPTAMNPTTIPNEQEGLRQAGYQNWKMMPAPTIYGRIKFLEAGLGVALVRRACIRPHLLQGALVELDTPLNLSIPIFLTWRRGSYLGDAGEHFRDQLIRNYRDPHQ